MRPKRISIASLMGFVVVFALGLVAFKQADATRSSAWFTATVLALTAGVFFAAFGRGRSRAFGAGFGLAGWIYLFVVYDPFTRADQGEPIERVTRGILRGLDRRDAFVYPTRTARAIVGLAHWLPGPFEWYMMRWAPGHFAREIGRPAP